MPNKRSRRSQSKPATASMRWAMSLERLLERTPAVPMPSMFDLPALARKSERILAAYRGRLRKLPPHLRPTPTMLSKAAAARELGVTPARLELMLRAISWPVAPREKIPRSMLPRIKTGTPLWREVKP